MSRGPTLERPSVAAITFHARGGGIAALSRLVVDALETGEHARPGRISLTEDPRGGTFGTTTLERMTFGMRLATAQCFGRCDWVFFTHVSLATAQRFVPAWGRAPYAVYLHDIEAWAEQPPARTRVLRGAFLRVANSEYTARRVAAANPEVGPIVACPLALGTDWEALAHTPPEAGPARPTVLIVGRMSSTERYKGHDQLLEAWPGVRARVPEARLVCAGEGDDVVRLREKAVQLGVSGVVDFPGFVSDTDRQALYRTASVFAMPSRREGFGLVYLEAMASGVPCVGSVHDAAGGVIVDGETGVLVDQGNAAELASAIVGVLTNENRRRAMGEAGRRRFLAEFTLDAFRRRLHGAIDSAVAHGTRAPIAGLRPSDL